MADPYFLIFYFYILTSFSQEYCIAAAYTLTPSQSIADGQTLVSQGSTFELGFFSPSGSNNRFLGIWYKTIPVQTVVWVANRDSPLQDTSGVLYIGASGNVVIVNQTRHVIWLSNSTKVVAEDPILEFLESGNLVLRNVRDRDPKKYLWQSFDYPGDTLLPGMKIGWNLKTGVNRFLTSWRNSDDPSQGDFIMDMDLNEYLELGIRNGTRRYFRTGPWNGIRFSGVPYVKPGSLFASEVVHNTEEIYYTYHLLNQSVTVRLVLTQVGSEAHLQRTTWDEYTHNWLNLVMTPRDRCDIYAQCGAYGTCDVMNVAGCQCLKGFKPKSLEEWSESNWSKGCVRETSLNCAAADGFIKYAGVRLPETKSSWVNATVNLQECREICYRNCSCMAYSNTDIRGDGSGCIMWFTDLKDIGQLSGGAGQDLYVRMAASEVGTKANSRTKGSVILIVSTSSVGSILVFVVASWCIWKKGNQKGGSISDNLELPIYDLVTITSATNNFSEDNKLGEGGFGPVYKGKLEGEKEIAVKRLSRDSMQGIEQFKNEVILISKLQHRNLVRLLGCCIKGAEKMLVYEYLQNKSLDTFIFDKTKCKLLEWQKRYQIILGIARGLLYLHHDSRLRIIHRDLKASNILLDSEMIPKISDFGMARLFSGDQIEAETTTVVGTYGYMSPEYVFDGQFSMKSDVFSFGVLVLEIISGKKNRGFSHPKHELNLLGHVWRLWSENKSMEVVDESILNSYSGNDVLQCIHIGLLCVQSQAEQRPTMSSVVLMLSSENAALRKPQPPGFYLDIDTPFAKHTSSSDNELSSSNDVTITILEAR